MAKHANQRPVLEGRQLLALARAVLRTEPVSDIADLSEAVKLRIARGGWAYPRPDLLTDVLTQVIRDAPAAVPASPPDPPGEARPLSDAEAKAALSRLIARFGPLPPMKPRPNHGDAFLAHLRTLVALRNAQRDVQRAREAGAEGLDQGLRPEALGPGGGGGRQEPAGGGDE